MASLARTKQKSKQQMVSETKGLVYECEGRPGWIIKKVELLEDVWFEVRSEIRIGQNKENRAFQAHQQLEHDI